MRLTFRANQWLGEYHGNGLDLKPEDVVEVSDGLAARLLGDFPENFFQIRLPTATDIASPPMDRQIKAPRGRKTR